MSLITNIITFLPGLSRLPGDSDDVAFEKQLIVVIAIVCCLCGLVWSALYFAVFGVGLVMALPLAFVVIVGSAIVVASRLRNHRLLVHAQLASITWITALISWSIGSTHNAGMVISWGFLGPIGALIFLTQRQAFYSLAQFLLILAVSLFFDPALLGAPLAVSDTTRSLFYLMNLGTSLAVVYFSAAWFVHTLQLERARSDSLLSNMLPAVITRRLKSDSATIADDHAEVSVLFADIVGFTTYSATVSAGELVADLNRVFRRFDELTAQFGVEKIKTIGDAYMVASGVPEQRDDHAVALADFALALQAAAATVTRSDGEGFILRVGIHSGPAVAGVIGSARYAYDLWGDTVNTASRMESHGEPGRVQISERTAALLGDEFELEPRGAIDVKGKGLMQLFFLGERRAIATKTTTDHG